MYDMYLLTDKIVEFAPRWFATTCDHEEEEDWDTDDKQAQPTEPEVDSISTIIEDVPTIDDDSTIFQHIRSSATGAPINITDTKIASLTTSMKRNSLGPSKHHLGTLSRLLIAALEQLLKDYQLYKSANTGIFVTKLELRTPNVNSFLIRKIYITPSTVLYEGPYREEKCAATRAFEEYQDRFLRVTFRDEGIEQDKLILECCLLFT
jgi:hypothetical protein